MQSADRPFKLGVVEGFFGIPWSWSARIVYADFLRSVGFNTYLYAPKSDRLLRQDWSLPFPQQHLRNLQNLAQTYKEHNIEFGIGLSPFELYKNFNTENKNQLQTKLDQINAINPSILCILFDDMDGGVNSLAKAQLEITDFIIEHSQASQFIFCPTYYSDDPTLESHFGRKPEHYLEDIGGSLDPTIDIFWTGPKVFSETYPEQHLQEIANKLKRKPLIWDNYPVNDAKRLTEFLLLKPFLDQTKTMQEYTSGQLANPMNQAYLSQLPLYSLANYYRGNNDSDQLRLACEKLCPAPLAKDLLNDAVFFQEQGLTALNENEIQTYIEKYSLHAEHPMAKEILDWLNGKYIFDPSCLS